MARNKSVLRKRRLLKAKRQNRRMPLFVVAKTKRKVSYNRSIRNWRSKKLKINQWEHVKHKKHEEV